MSLSLVPAKFGFDMRTNGSELLLKELKVCLCHCVPFSLCFQAFFTEKYLQEHPEDQDKIELLKQQIAIQVWNWARAGGAGGEGGRGILEWFGWERP